MDTKILDKYRMNVMLHQWKGDADIIMDAVKAFGFSGVVTNVPSQGGFVSNRENLKVFDALVKKMRARNFEYWIYDESGYPSGQAGGLTLAENKELEAKGLYMRKYEAFLEPVDFIYHIDGVSDRIFYAVRYRQDLRDVCEARILYDTAEEIPFEERSVHISLNPGEVGYIFIVKPAYEGAHTVHNISSRKRYINLLCEVATERFLNVAYRSIAEASKEAFPGSKAVFTDEPSLMVVYVREHETFNYALVPFEETFFDIFENKYGYRLEAMLPLLYESTDERCHRIRIDFYQLIGEVVATNYTKKLADFCREHGTCFSGHYLAEENVIEHVMDYGNYVRVLTESGYPGMDVLQCTPEDFFWNAPKFLQMISRKKDSDGFMVELCTFFNKEVFEKDHYENAMGTVSILCMYGARKINTYYLPDLREYDEEQLEKMTGEMTQAQANAMNAYVAHIGTVLQGKRPVCDTYVYYAIEDVQAKLIPSIYGRYFQDKQLTKLDDCFRTLADLLLKRGLTYAFCDESDLCGDFSCRRIVVPEIDFISKRTLEALRLAEERGTEVLFLGKVPKAVEETENPLCCGKVVSYGELFEIMKKEKEGQTESAFSDNLYIQKYEDDYIVIYNNNKCSVSTTISNDCIVFDPASGDTREVRCGGNVEVESYRVLIIKEERQQVK